MTNTTLSCDRRSSAEEAEQISQALPNLESKEESDSAEVTLNEMFEHTNEESQNMDYTQPKISREGMRKQKKSNACLAQSSYRQRKSDEQVKILADLYQKHNGKLNRKVRKEAMAKTGLAWIQIYKWFFDRQLKKSAIEKACCT